MSSEAQAPAAPLPILYKSVIPLTKDQHRNWRIDTPKHPLGFAKGAHLVPALVEEFVIAARELPIIFLPEGDQFTSVFILGLKPGVNSLIDERGLWKASYVPAYIRRYPFILGEVDGREPILCIDQGFEGFNEAKGAPMFDAAGEPTEQLRNALDFAGGFRTSANMSNQFVAQLKALGLLKQVTLDVKSPKAGDVRVDGVFIVDEDKLQKLPDDELLKMARNGSLRAIHAHLVSLNAIHSLG